MSTTATPRWALALGQDLEAESRLALVVERLHRLLNGRPDTIVAQEPAAIARRARELLDDDPAAVSGIAALYILAE